MSEHTDVLIIGGGVIGLSSAYYLNLAGRSVRIVEQNTIGSGASHGNCGMVCPSHAPPLTQPGVVATGLKWMLKPDAPLFIRPTLNLRTISWLLHFAARCDAERMRPAMVARADILRSSRVAYDAFIEAEDLAAAIEWSPVGALFICREAATMDHCAEYFGLVAEFDMKAVPLAGAELAAKEPAVRDDVAGAWYFDLDAHLRPDRLMREWHRVNLERGVIVSENSAVSAIYEDGDKITGVSTSSGPYTADSVVVATGAWSSQLAGMFHTQIPIEPGKGYSITTTCPKLSPVHPCAFQERRCIATPFQSGYRLGGTMEFSGFDPRLRQNRINAIRRAASEYLKEPEGDTVEELWYGWRPMTYDGVPIIGQLPKHRNAYIAAGHNMLGLSMATGTGKLISELLTGAEPHIDPRPYRADRF